ncbi:MAG: hypothetical protein KY457_10325 [Actinobacteria bacterium]|nr:hypothetical protein [Actinomycetota bacterium]
MTVEVTGRRELRFEDGTPVRSASAVARLGGGWLVAQDDATSGAWLPTRDAVTAVRLRLLPPVDGDDVFSEAAGTKRSKPDLESAVELPPASGNGVLLLGSGSLPNRRRGVVVTPRDGGADVAAADLGPLYAAVSAALDLPPGECNLEGACLAGGSLRWFQRGRGAEVPSASVDVALDALLAVFDGRAEAGEVPLGRVHAYDLGRHGDAVWAVTDAVALADDRILVSASAEDTDDPVADGPVSGSAVALLAGAAVAGVAAIPASDDEVLKLEGIAVVAAHAGGAVLLGVVDQDDPTVPSVALDLAVAW